MQPCLHNSPRRTDRVDASVKRVLIAGTFDRNVHADSFSQIPDFLWQFTVCRIEYLARHAESGHFRGARGVGVANENLRSAGRMTGKRSEHANRTRTRDKHRRADCDATAIHGIECHCGRLDQRALLVADGVGQLVRVIVVKHRIFGHTAAVPAQTHTAHLRAKMTHATHAVVALTAGRERHHGNAVARLHVLDVLADLNHFRAELMSQHLRRLRAGQRMGFRGDDNRSRPVFVQVGSTDAAPHRLDDHLVCAHAARVGHILDANVVGTMKTDSSHGSTPV